MVVGHLQAPGDGQGDRHRLAPCEATPGADHLLDGLPAHELHREVGLIVVLTEGEELDDGRMAQLLERVDLRAESSLEPGVVGEVCGEHLDRHRRSRGRVDGLVHRPHPPAAESRADPVGAELFSLHGGGVDVVTDVPGGETIGPAGGDSRSLSVDWLQLSNKSSPSGPESSGDSP